MLDIIMLVKKKKNTGTENGSVVARDWEGAYDYKRVGLGSFGGERAALYPDCSGGHMNLYVELYTSQKLSFTVC